MRASGCASRLPQGAKASRYTVVLDEQRVRSPCIGTRGCGSGGDGSLTIEASVTAARPLALHLDMAGTLAHDAVNDSHASPVPALGFRGEERFEHAFFTSATSRRRIVTDIARTASVIAMRANALRHG